MPSKKLLDFKKFLPLMGNKYFFPNFAPYGRKIISVPEGMWNNEDEMDEYFASTILFNASLLDHVAQYPSEISSKTPKINTSNFDVVSFLSSDTRNYLVRNDMMDTRFHVEWLTHKQWVMIYCFSCPTYYNSSKAFDSIAVSHVCSELYQYYGDSFEMVLVFKMTEDFLVDESAFRHMLSGFPSSCLVVPFQDSHSRDSIWHALDFTTTSMGLFVCPHVRKVLWKRSLSFFRDYGVDAFPFIDQVFHNFVANERIELLNYPSLQTLLPSPPAPHLYKTPVGADSIELTSIDQLQEKLVGVYLCIDGKSIPMLHQLYEGCKAKNIAFEVVVVYSAYSFSHPDPYLLMKMIDRILLKRNLCWWAFPFKSWISLRLLRLCRYPMEDELIIVGNRFVDMNGTDFMSKFGTELNNEELIDEFKRRYQTFLHSDMHRNVTSVVLSTLDSINVYQGCMPTMSAQLSAEEAAGMDTNGNDCGSEPTVLRTGSHLNVISFLSTHLQSSRGLVRCSSNKEIVGFDVLKGKVVMLCCFSLPFDYKSPNISLARSVSLAFPDLYALGGFELVLVVNVYVGGDKAFNEFLSWFPSSCLAVPYSDCKAVCRSLEFVYDSLPSGVLVNRNQTVVWRKPLNFFLNYGADAFPFTLERLSEITDLEKKLKPWETWCPLEEFLCSYLLPFPKRVNLLRKIPRREPEKERICDIERRHVGLYVCQTGDLIPTLGRVHKNCCDLGLEFEIILVYVPSRYADDPQLFEDSINKKLEEQNISWWVLPFVYWVSRRLWRLCHNDVNDRLIIIDPKSKFVELHGEAVISRFDIDAYPFSRKDLINRELDRFKGVTLESLLVHSSRDYVHSKGTSDHPIGKKVPVAELRGRKVILYLHCEEDDLDNKKSLYYHLKKYYRRMKASDGSFEVVFVGLDKYFPGGGGVKAMPWLACPFDQEHSSFVSKKIFREGTGKRSTLLAFGTDGEICSVDAERYLHFPSTYSLFNDNLLDDIKTNLFVRNQVPLCCL